MNKDFPNGIEYYTKGKAEVDIFFPEDKITCQWCDYCAAEYQLDRYHCKLTPTKRIIQNPFVGRPSFCPISKLEVQD